MKKITLITLVLSIIFGTQVRAQQELTQDPAAKKILDKVSAKTKSYETIQIKFSYTIEDKKENVNETNKGYAFLKGNKYKLMIPGTEVFSDGKTVWSYIKDAEEIDITEPGEEEESIFNPAKLFTIYEKGFKYSYLGENKESAVKYAVIDLFPENPGQKEYSRIRLFIDIEKDQIYSIKTFGKNGVDYTITVDEFKSGVKLPDALFVFDKSKYPATVEVVDMR